MCHIEQLTTTDRVLLGQHVAIITPDVSKARPYVTRVARSLRARGHHVYHSINRVALDNGGALEALTPVEARGRALGHVITVGAVDHGNLLPAVVPTGGTISRR